MELRELMGGLAAACGIDGMATDDDGVYNLSVDDMTVSIMSLDESGQLVIWAEVCEPPPEGRECLYRLLMQSMFMGQATDGAMFSIESESGKVYLQRIEFLSALDVESFTGLVEKFVNVLERWRKIIVDFRPVASEMERVAAEDSEIDRQSGMGMGGFMQV